ncbi:pilin [Photobacterium aquimaris]|uniref:Prepilin-type cleavage/methylation domain-containing protein n=1 Tax=Photobacterium aquimaris TaxID=512643 RepID=A0A2T3I0Y6_9GAMM|nr:pilin [Photobacterium aquimaris]OBU26245.1 prepilin-type N-terminal cleavage/methylation domain-containing protein [Photobacterium aquimaris]PQJ41996.1 prepilin-type N-terminal cleavage/methylation domain-containing protein [Photobacterium aquimaris]PSU10178.1 prepilin-type cleavage/methylation domain-containing protein [Photobacterium aquimaris]
MKKQQGFTLIELMIVVAVIGVLSAIAIPQYQKYVAKAEVASALATMSGVKTNVEAYTAEYGVFPASAADSALGIPTSMDLGAISLTQTSGSEGTMTYTFNSTNVNSLLINTDFLLTRTASGTWDCTTSGATSAVPSDLLPKSCK